MTSQQSRSVTDESRTSISTPVLASHARFGEGVPHRIVVAFHRPSHPSRAGARFSVGLRSRPQTGERRASRRSCRLASYRRMPRDPRASWRVSPSSRPMFEVSYAILNSVGCTAAIKVLRGQPKREPNRECRPRARGVRPADFRVSFGHHRLAAFTARETHPTQYRIDAGKQTRSTHTRVAVHLDTEPEEVVGFAERKRSANRTILALTPSRCHLVRWMLESPCAVVPSAGMKVRSGPLQGAVTA